MANRTQIRSQIETQGFALVENLLAEQTIRTLLESLGETSHSQRNLLAEPMIEALAESADVKGYVAAVLGADAFPIRAILFDKIEGANWKVPWHQDLIIPVAEKREVAGFTGWSVKEGVPHVHPPAEVLARMLTIRLHLDDCGPDNGPLRVLPGSHRHGKLTADAIRGLRSERESVVCAVAAGGAVLMRPLLLHASSPALKPAHRRVVHLEFARESLPGGLMWGRA